MQLSEVRILAFAGSLRKESFNKKLVRIAASGARGVGAQVTLIDLKDFPMPPYDGDLEENEGLPESTKRLKELMKSHHAFLISTPEYNSSVPGTFKNVIDWASRKSEESEPPLVAFRGKMALVMSASPGPYGGVQSLGAVTSILSNIGVAVLPDRIAIQRAADAFDADGNLKDPAQQKTVVGFGEKLARAVSATSA